MTNPLSEEIAPQTPLRYEFEGLSGESVAACFQCEKCSSGCPVTFAMDIMPHHVIRLLDFGQLTEVLKSDTIWVCASCETCSTRCPNDIDIAHIMDTLRQMTLQEGAKAAQPSVPIFHTAFLDSIKRFGRVHEAMMAVAFSLRNGGFNGLLKQAGTGLSMLTHGKIKLMPYKILGNQQVRELFSKTEEG